MQSHRVWKQDDRLRIAPRGFAYFGLLMLVALGAGTIIAAFIGTLSAGRGIAFTAMAILGLVAFGGGLVRLGKKTRYEIDKETHTVLRASLLSTRARAFPGPVMAVELSEELEWQKREAVNGHPTEVLMVFKNGHRETLLTDSNTPRAARTASFVGQFLNVPARIGGSHTHA